MRRYAMERDSTLNPLTWVLVLAAVQAPEQMWREQGAVIAVLIATRPNMNQPLGEPGPRDPR